MLLYGHTLWAFSLSIGACDLACFSETARFFRSGNFTAVLGIFFGEHILRMNIYFLEYIEERFYNFLVIF